MITRELAVAVVETLEGALDRLRESLALANAMTSQEAVACMEPLSLATANTGGMLALIYKDYPDLVGEDAEGSGELDAGIAGRRSGPKPIERIVALLEDARSLLEQANALAAQVAGVASSDRERLAVRFAESDAAIRSTVEALGSASR